MKPEEFLQRSVEQVQNLDAAMRREVKVGLPEGEATAKAYEGGATVLQVGAAHEFGTEAVPVRSFLRMPHEKRASELSAYIAQQFKRVLMHGADAVQGLGLIGTKALNISREAFQTGGWGEWPDIEQATKDRKGSSAILTDTGILKGALTYEVAKK